MEILENQIKFLHDFVRLNEEWITLYFKIEEVDIILARNPKSIIDNGGYIFTLLENDIVVGVCALFKEGDGVFELARMAVSPEFQSKGYGAKLIETALEKLKCINATKVYLVSNTKLKSAIHLYKKYNFVVTFQGAHPVYSRANIVMERVLT